MHTFLRSFNTFTHISGTLLLQKLATVKKKIPVAAPSFHGSTLFHTKLLVLVSYITAILAQNQ